MDRHARPYAFHPAAFFQAGVLLLAALGCTPAEPAVAPARVEATGTGEPASAAPDAAPSEPPASSASPAQAEGALTESSAPPAAGSSPPEAAPPAAPEPIRLPPPVGTKVLHVGDSFAGALGIPLGELLEGAGVRSILKHKDSSYLTTWAWEPELARELWHYNPDLVVITLGANELGIADPAQREKTVRKIVSTIGERPCLWVAIPLWSERHNGLLQVIEDSSAPCVFYDTNEELDTLKMERIHDGIHPTNAARREWAEAVFEYILAHRQPREGAPWWLVADPGP